VLSTDSGLDRKLLRPVQGLEPRSMSVGWMVVPVAASEQVVPVGVVGEEITVRRKEVTQRGVVDPVDALARLWRQSDYQITWTYANDDRDRGVPQFL
jgi:hypothetical protein